MAVLDQIKSFDTGFSKDDFLKIFKNALEMPEKLDEKVDKDGDKQLSDENFTLEDKNKLDSLENYDDSDIRQLISNLTQKIEELEAKVNGD